MTRGPNGNGTRGPEDGPASTGLAWRTVEMSFHYPTASTPAVDRVSLTVPPGACTALLGPNGSGKSTLLRLLLATLRPQTGAVELGDRPLAEWDRRSLARAVGVVPQHEEIAFPLTVRELVAMGRYPHLGLLRPGGAADVAAVEEAMERCDIAPLAERLFTTLSGGERQRARLARALAQQPRVLALDEPTVALDVRHEMEIFHLLREFARSGGTVLVVTHNINLAARFADRLALLHRGRLMVAGSPDEVLKPEMLEPVYEWPLQVTRHTEVGVAPDALQVIPLIHRDRAAGAGAPGDNL